MFQQFLVVLVDGEGQVFRFGIGDIDDIEFIFAVLGQKVIGNRFVENGCRRNADLEFHDGFGVIVELFDRIALFFGIFSASRTDLDGNLFALQVGYGMDAAVFRCQDDQFRFVERSGKGDFLGPFLGDGHARSGDIHVTLLDDGDDTRKSDVVEFDITAHFFGYGADQVHFKALIFRRLVVILEFKRNKRRIGSDAKRFLRIVGSIFLVTAAAGQHRSG